MNIMFKYITLWLICTFASCAAHAGVCIQFSRFDINVLVGTEPDASCIDALTDTSIALRPDGSVDIVLIKDKNSQAIDFSGWVRTDRVINSITFHNDSGKLMIVRIEGTNGAFANSPPEIRSIDISGTGTGRVILLDLQCRGDVGSVRVNGLDGMEIDGDLVGPVLCEQRLDSDMNPVGGLWVGNSNIIRGDVLNDINIFGGVAGLDTSITIEGSLGTPSNPVIARFLTLPASAVITCSEANARVVVFDLAGRFRTTTDFGGSGDFNGDMRITNTLTKDGSIEIGGALGTNGRIRFRNDFGDCATTQGPIQGRISINHEGAVAPANAWLGEVRVDVIDFADPTDGTVIDEEYLTAACELGDGSAQDAIGSVGVAPFVLHVADSVPLFGSNRGFSASAEPADFELRHYGAIQLDTTAGVSVQLQRQAICDDGSSNWEDVTSRWAFTYSVDSTGDNSILNMMSGQNANFRNGYQYRFVVQNDPMVAGLVSCDLEDVSATVPVDPYPMGPWFTVGNSCSADFDGSGTVDLADLNAVLADFDTPHETNRYADTNADGLVNLTDLNRVLADFDSLCCSASLLGGGAGDSIAQELGYTCADGYCDAIAQMTRTEREAAFDALLAEAAEW